jgi:hypothetical protein
MHLWVAAMRARQFVKSPAAIQGLPLYPLKGSVGSCDGHIQSWFKT